MSDTEPQSQPPSDDRQKRELQFMLPGVHPGEDIDAFKARVIRALEKKGILKPDGRSDLVQKPFEENDADSHAVPVVAPHSDDSSSDSR